MVMTLFNVTVIDSKIGDLYQRVFGAPNSVLINIVTFFLISFRQSSFNLSNIKIFIRLKLFWVLHRNFSEILRYGI